MIDRVGLFSATSAHRNNRGTQCRTVELADVSVALRVQNMFWGHWQSARERAALGMDHLVEPFACVAFVNHRLKLYS